MSFCDGIKGKSTPTIERVKEHDIFAVSIDVAFRITHAETNIPHEMREKGDSVMLTPILWDGA